MADPSEAPRVVIAAGGTGGHVYPGIAIAEEWMSRRPGSQVTFIGSRRGLEAGAVERAGFPLRTIPARGLPRRPSFALVTAAIGFVAGLANAWRILIELRPHVVIATGGYVSGPVGVVARLLGIPLVLQEQNSVPGVANRWLSLIAQQVHISFLESRSHFRRRNHLKVSGNPIRRAILRQDRTSAYGKLGLDPHKRTLLVFGGSLGAHSLNQTVAATLSRLRGTGRLQVLWQTGRDDFDGMLEVARRAPIQVRVVRYLESMEQAYAVADLAICRAGAMTVAELTASGVPAILVPYPYATHDHQTVNAQGLVDRGAAEMVADRDLDANDLADRVRALFLDEPRLRRMARNARAFSKTNAAERIVRSIEDLLQLSGPDRDA